MKVNSIQVTSYNSQKSVQRQQSPMYQHSVSFERRLYNPKNEIFWNGVKHIYKSIKNLIFKNSPDAIKKNILKTLDKNKIGIPKGTTLEKTAIGFLVKTHKGQILKQIFLNNNNKITLVHDLFLSTKKVKATYAFDPEGKNVVSLCRFDEQANMTEFIVNQPKSNLPKEVEKYNKGGKLLLKESYNEYPPHNKTFEAVYSKKTGNLISEKSYLPDGGVWWTKEYDEITGNLVKKTGALAEKNN